MRTHPDNNQQFGPLDAGLIFLRVTQFSAVNGVRAGNLVTACDAG
jgi:hypothetical protein